MVSNDGRRSAAARLRGMAAEADRPGLFHLIVITATGCYGDAGDWRALCKGLADLIDRPTCEALYYEERDGELIPADEAEADFCQCGSCGERLCWTWGRTLPGYCHRCGAEVER